MSKTKKALEMSARAWGTDATSSIEVDSRVAIAFADILGPCLAYIERLEGIINEMADHRSQCAVDSIFYGSLIAEAIAAKPEGL